MKFVIVNHAHSNICGIHDLGRRIAARLDNHARGHVYYVEAARAAHIPEADVTLFNYRADLTPWVPDALRSMWGVKAAILHNYDLATLNERAAELLAVGFDRVVVLDPDARPADPRVIVAGRFLPNRVADVALPDDHLRIGSFGFAFPHKRFDLVAGAVRELGLPLGAVTFRLHTPEAYFNGNGGGPLYADGIHDACAAILPEPLLEHTTDHRSDADVVAWLAGNHVNCLLYTPGQPDGGLSSALDYLLAARRPILVSDAAMFRHGRGCVVRWPERSLWNVTQSMRALTRCVTDLADHYDDTAAGQLLDGLMAAKAAA